MKKLTLDLEALEVESFAADEPHDARGTVLAAAVSGTLPICCVSFTCGDSQVRPCQVY
jgi:hypothetical protein